MNDHTEKLIRELAEKLGTTTEHLWGVLIKQAPIDATLILVMSVAMLLLLWFGGIKLRAYIKTEEAEEDRVYVWFALLVVFALVTFVFCMQNAENVAAGLFNPEFWALKEVMRTINGHK